MFKNVVSIFLFGVRGGVTGTKTGHHTHNLAEFGLAGIFDMFWSGMKSFNKMGVGKCRYHRDLYLSAVFLKNFVQRYCPFIWFKVFFIIIERESVN